MRLLKNIFLNHNNDITFHGLAYPKLTWCLPTLSLTTNSSWLPWGKVAMPLISPLMPVLIINIKNIYSPNEWQTPVKKHLTRMSLSRAHTYAKAADVAQ